MADIPVVNIGLEVFKALYEQHPPSIFGIRQREGHEIILLEDSTIDSTPMNLNLFKNDEYFEAMLRAQQEMTALFLEQDAPEEEIPEAVIQEMQAFLSEAFDSSLVSMLPVQKNVHSGVYVIPLSREFLEESVMAEMTPFMNLLDYGLQFMNFSGYFNPGSFQNLIMDQENQIASFNASVSLGNVEIDGRKTDAILNNIGFIVTGHERAIFVNLIYLSVDNIAVYESLQDFLESLRFTG